MSDIKVIHLPTTVGGNPQGISRHLNEIGVKSETLTLNQNYFGYPADRVIMNGKEGTFLRELKKFIALRYIFQCDVAFFNFGTGIYSPYYRTRNDSFSPLKKRLVLAYDYFNEMMARLEILLLTLLNKPIFIQYQGDDARQGDYCLEHFPVNFVKRVDANYYTNESDSAKRKRIKFYANKAKKIYALNPDLLFVLPDKSEFLPYSHISLEEWTPVYSQLENRSLRIGHAPSHRGVKGTELILEAVIKLKSEGHSFEFILIEGMSNTEAKEVYKKVDILVDQLFAGWYGGLAVEAMALGKPVIAYIRETDLHFIPEGMREELPILQCEPDSIYDNLKNVLEMPREQLLAIAKQSRRYVEKWHNPITIAERLKNDMLCSFKGNC